MVKFHQVLVAVSMLFLSGTSYASQCLNTFDVKPVEAQAVPLQADITLDGKPNIVDLLKVFPKLEWKVFLGVEAWGHSFLQVGSLRLDGHVLKPIDVKPDSVTMRHGFVAEIKGVSSAQFVGLQQAVQTMNGKMAVSCVHEALKLLRTYLNLDVSGEKKDYIWLTDLAEALLQRPNRSIDVRFSKEMDGASFIEKLRKQELTWRNQILTAISSEPSVQALLAGDKSKHDSVNRLISERYQLSKDQADFLIAEFFTKIETGEHSISKRDSLVTDHKTSETFLNEFAYEQLKSEFVETNSQIATKLSESALDREGRARATAASKRIRKTILDIKPEDVERELQLMPHEEMRLVSVWTVRDFYPASALRMFSNPDQLSLANSVANMVRDIQETAQRLKPALESVSTSSGKVDTVALITAAHAIGIKGNDLKLSIEAFSRTNPPKARSSHKWIETWAKWHVQNRTKSRFALTSEMFSGQEGIPLRPDGRVVSEVLEHAKRFRESGEHTLDVRGYAERHLTPSTLTWMQKSMAPIRIYGSTRLEAFRDLYDLGLTEIAELPRNKMTDFDQWVARRPDTGETVFVLRTLSGRTPIIEAVAHFLYPTNEIKIDPARISVFRSGVEPSQAMQKILKDNGAKPDVLVIGYTRPAVKVLTEMGAKETKVIKTEDLRATLYSLNGREILVSVIEPHLFGDRASELVDATNEVTKHPPSIIFAGTAGSLSPSLKLNEVVVPTEFTAANGLVALQSPPIRNWAKETLQAAPIDGLHLQKVWRHGSVDTILFEDKSWYASHRKNLDVVEQELFDVVRVSAKIKARLSAVLRISDELHSDLNFSANEVHRRNYQGPDMAVILKRLLEKELAPSKGKVIEFPKKHRPSASLNHFLNSATTFLASSA